MLKLGFYLFLAILMLACGGYNTSTQLQDNNIKKNIQQDELEITSTTSKENIPVKQFELYLNGFYFYNGYRAGQLEAHCYCTELNEDLSQCVIFDGNGKNARLTGVEYIISERWFIKLPEDERKLWHSYRYEAKSGLLTAPNLSLRDEHQLMSKLVSSYSKTWQMWHIGQDSTLPSGNPALMMGFTRDGQLDPDLLQKRDKRFNVSSKEKWQQRSDILGRPAQPGADSWQNGPVIQLPPLTARNYPHLHKDSLK